MNNKEKKKIVLGIELLFERVRSYDHERREFRKIGEVCHFGGLEYAFDWKDKWTQYRPDSEIIVVELDVDTEEYGSFSIEKRVARTKDSK